MRLDAVDTPYNIEEMNMLLTVHQKDLEAVLQPGVTLKQLNQHLRDTGLPIDRGVDA